MALDAGFAPRTELTNEEKDMIKSVFESFDRSGDGKLSLQEMEAAMKKVCDSIPENEIKLLIDDLDENGDNEVDYSEFYTIMRKKLLGLENEDDILQAFSLIDKDKNGFISPAELRHLLTNIGRNPLTQEEADELIQMADTDGDGLINYNEFFKSLMGDLKSQ
eukprot:GDKI01047994.1.p1 GENE.GDKI01047994.1~~GDKI01047994.1.p1  ORF type:complete len:163 (+),score=71.32 GDKI01047994.1:112-600(+)